MGIQKKIYASEDAEVFSVSNPKIQKIKDLDSSAMNVNECQSGIWPQHSRLNQKPHQRVSELVEIKLFLILNEFNILFVVLFPKLIYT